MIRALGVLLVVVLAGCAEGPADAPEGPTPGPAPDVPQLSGSVVDAALVPVAGAVVEIASEGVRMEVDGHGAYAFSGLAVGVPLVVVVTAEGFIAASKAITLEPDTPRDLDFQLERVPVIEPFHKTEAYEGFISCAVKAEGAAGTHGAPCDVSEADVRTWDVRLDAAVEGVVIEVAWEAASEAAKDLNVTVEALGFGDQNALLAAAEGPSILRAQISNAAANRYYTDQGGVFRVTVDIGSDAEGNEAGSDAGVAFQQEFQLFVSAFYHAPPPAGFTIA